MASKKSSKTKKTKKAKTPITTEQLEHNAVMKERYEYHPVMQTEIIFLSPENRTMSEVMTKFEYIEIISQRAKQIESGGICFTDVEELSDPIEMAKKELYDKKCPASIIRMHTDKVGEIWQANECALPDF